MNHPFVFNLMGVVLLTTAFVLHMVCLTTPYYSVANMNSLASEVKNLVQNDPSSLGLTDGVSQEQLAQALASLASMAGGSVNFGMWKVCLSSDQENLHLCPKWTQETTFDMHSHTVKTLESEGWIRAVQAMAILGVIFLTFALSAAIVNMVVKSKGDRLRFLYLFIIFFCAVAALFIFIGDIIMASKHRSAFDPVTGSNPEPPPRQLYHLFTKRFSLSWGFVLDIVAVALTLLAGVAHFIGGRIANFSGIV